jgi:hypothetical protein
VRRRVAAEKPHQTRRMKRQHAFSSRAPPARWEAKWSISCSRRAKGNQVRVLMRDLGRATKFRNRVSVAHGDLKKPEPLGPALDGTEKVFPLSNGPGDRSSRKGSRLDLDPGDGTAIATARPRFERTHAYRPLSTAEPPEKGQRTTPRLFAIPGDVRLLAHEHPAGRTSHSSTSASRVPVAMTSARAALTYGTETAPPVTAPITQPANHPVSRAPLAPGDSP